MLSAAKNVSYETIYLNMKFNFRFDERRISVLNRANTADSPSGDEAKLIFYNGEFDPGSG